MGSFDIRAGLRDDAVPETEDRPIGQVDSAEFGRSLWHNAILVSAAHARRLFHDGAIDEGAFAAINRALDAVYGVPSTEHFRANRAVREIDERVETLLPREIAGAASLGASRVETLATALRMRWRESTLEVFDGAAAFRSALLDLAQVHAVTIMAAVWDRRPAAPTTLAHFLGGVIGPLALTSDRLKHALEWLDRSPYGAGILAGEVMGIDREEIADDLGFAGTVGNTLDALSSVEEIVSLAEAVGANLAASRRLMSELLTWIRTEPTSFFLDERWESIPEPSMPAHRTSERLESLVLTLQAAEGEVRATVDLLRSLPYGPIGAAWDTVATSMDRMLASGRASMHESAAAINDALIVNRAFLANRAGRAFTTASDLAPFLMQEEGLAPTPARQIASLVISRLREENLEASAVTPDMIDSAALMVIGQELKVEMETLGRYIAPRRFIERRDVLGSPAPERTRQWLATERERLDADRSWAAARRQRWDAATSSLLGAIRSGEDEE